MTTLTIDILDDKAINLIKDLELLNIIRVHNKQKSRTEYDPKDFIARYKGAMTKQPLDEVNKQLEDLRNEWE